MDLLDELREQLGLRHDEVCREVLAARTVHLRGAVPGKALLGGLEPVTDEHRGRFAQASGDGQQLAGCLAQLAVEVVDENEYFSHGQ